MMILTVIFIFCCLCPGPAGAETIQLKSGKVIEGDIVSQTDRMIKIRSDGRTLSIQKKFIKEKGSSGARRGSGQDREAGGTPEAALPFSLMDVEISTENYSMSPSMKEEIDYVISKMFAVYEGILGLDFNRERTFKARLFGDFNAYKAYQAQISTSRSDTGFYSLRNKEMVLWRNKNDRAMLRILFHEASHAILRKQVRRCPPWIDEGLAEFFEYGTYQGGNVIVSPQNHKDRRIKKWVRDRTLMPLKDYFDFSESEWRQRNGQEGAPMSTIAWSLTTFLFSTDRGRATLSGVIHELRRFSHDNFPSYRVVDHYYPGGVAQLEQDWHAWMMQARTEYLF